MKRNLYVGAIFLTVLGTLIVASVFLEKKAAVEAAGTMAPRFEVDPFWPKPLPNHWILGQTIGVSVDAQDHVWIIHRAGSLEAGEQHATTNPPIAQCCAPAPPILQFDQEGGLVSSFGGPGPGYDWPESNIGARDGPTGPHNPPGVEGTESCCDRWHTLRCFLDY